MTDTVPVSRELLRRVLDFCEAWPSYNGKECADALRAALDATCHDSRHVPGCVDAGMQAAPMQAQFTDDELDLFRQWYNSVQDTNGGYLVELDHALFRKLRAIKEAPVQEAVWVDVALRASIAQAVYNQVRRELSNAVGPWCAFDATEQQRIVDAIKPFLPAQQPRKAVKLSDSEIASDASRHWSEDGVDPIAFAHAIESAVWAKLGVES